ncbi:MAG: epoxyqueuosine reductase QueH [Candidatus Riflebacteria bacterium]
MTILLHSCCGPCLGGSIDILKQNVGNESIDAFWFNPNIHPYLEYRERLLSFGKLCAALNLKAIYGPVEYGLEHFLQKLNGKHGEERCAQCYRMRFEDAARTAARLNYRAFTTTLLVSPYQQHELIKEVGTKTAEEFGTEFFYCDFRPGFRNTHEAAKTHELYKQKYCGCIFSEFDRYKNDKKHALPPLNFF